MSVKNYVKPRTIEDVSALLQAGGAMPIAGGTDVMIKMRRGAIRNMVLVNIKGVRELGAIVPSRDGLLLGSTVPLSVVASDERIVKNYPALSAGAINIGTPQIRNLGTIGGNACNASPCADTAPGLLVSGARVLIAKGRETREMKIGDFWVGPGKSVLEPGEIVTGFLLPTPREGARQGFLKLGPRRAADIAVVNAGISFVVAGGVCSDVRIALGSVAPKPIRATRAEAQMEGIALEKLDFKAIALAAIADASPISDVRGSEWYRNEAVGALVQELLLNLAFEKRG